MGARRTLLLLLAGVLLVVNFTIAAHYRGGTMHWWRGVSYQHEENGKTYVPVSSVRIESGCPWDNQVTISGCPSKFLVVRNWNEGLVLYLNLSVK